MNLVDESTSTEPSGNPEQGSQDTSKSSDELPMEPRAKVEPELCRIRNRKGLLMSDDGCYSQWRSANKYEATVYVKELDLFVTVMLLQETPAVLSLGKFCEDHGYIHHWTSGRKPQLTKKARKLIAI